MEVSNELFELLSKKYGIALTSINENSRITDDIGFSSFDIVVLLCDIENHFGIIIDEADFMRLQTVGEVIHYIEEKNVR